MEATAHSSIAWNNLLTLNDFKSNISKKKKKKAGGSPGICSFGRQVRRPWKTDVTLPCKTLNEAEGSWNWLLNSKSLKNNDSARYRFENGNLLSIQQLKRSDAGNYSCSVSNGFSVSSISYQLVVLGKNLFLFQEIWCIKSSFPFLSPSFGFSSTGPADCASCTDESESDPSPLEDGRRRRQFSAGISSSLAPRRWRLGGTPVGSARHVNTTRR